MPASRRTALLAGAASLTASVTTLSGCSWLRPAAPENPHAHHGGMYERLNAPGRVGKPELAATQNVFDSPSPRPTRRASG